MRKFISILFIVVGITLISLPFVSQIIIANKTKHGLELLDELDSSDIKNNNAGDADFDFSAVRDLDVSSAFKGFDENFKDAIIGHLVIPDVGINLPILKGTTDPHLMVGATTMKKEQDMGQGNYSLAGHYTKKKGWLFGGLMDIEKNNLIRITDKETIYEYKVYDTLIVPDTSVHLIEDNLAEKKGKPIISLMSCYYTSKNGKRFFALAELVNHYPFELEKFIE